MQAQATHPLRQKGLPGILRHPASALISRGPSWPPPGGRPAGVCSGILPPHLRPTKIDRAGSAALHLEQIETRLMLTRRHQQTQVGG